MKDNKLRKYLGIDDEGWGMLSTNRGLLREILTKISKLERYLNIRLVNKDTPVYQKVEKRICKTHGVYENFTDNQGCPVCQYNKINK